jgi:hypothetical protein
MTGCRRITSSSESESHGSDKFSLQNRNMRPCGISEATLHCHISRTTHKQVTAARSEQPSGVVVTNTQATTVSHMLPAQRLAVMNSVLLELLNNGHLLLLQDFRLRDCHTTQTQPSHLQESVPQKKVHFPIQGRMLRSIAGPSI